MSTAIRLHWARSKPNFGDWLSPQIVECVSGRPVKYAKIDQCDLVAIGSLLQRVRNRFWTRPVHIWGAGFIEQGKGVKTRHHIHAVRGPASLARLGKTREGVAFGDPGLLADRLLDGTVIAKRHRLSVIAHYKDKTSEGLKRFCQSNPDVNVIDVFSDTNTVLREIAASHCVVSSAMHGLIASDAMGVPNCRVVFSGDLRGGEFKFDDYYKGTGFQPFLCQPESFDKTQYETLLNHYRRPGLPGVKAALEAAFPDM